jgi:hypothetical protein
MRCLTTVILYCWNADNDAISYNVTRALVDDSYGMSFNDLSVFLDDCDAMFYNDSSVLLKY